MQFIKPTFDAYARQAREANPGAWKGTPLDWLNPRAQALAASWAIKNGHGSAWATYQRALKKSGKAVKGQSKASKPLAGMGQGGSIGLNDSTSVSPIDSLIKLMEKRNPGGAPALNLLRSMSKPRVPTVSMPDRQSQPVGLVNSDGKDWKWLQQQAKRFALRNDDGDSQTTGGSHSKGSEHYDGRAIDFGNAKNTQAQLNAWAAWARKQGLDVLNEGDHMHVSLPGSGT
jgi:hypothetical protein